MDSNLLYNLFNKVNRYTKISTDEECLLEKREVENQVTSINAFWNICNSIQGVAILAMPYVIKGGGWWSIVSMVVIASISNYTGQILLDCHYETLKNQESGEVIRKRTRISYADIGFKVWPWCGKDLILIVQILELLFMATLYPIVATSVFKTLCPFKISSAIWVLIFGIVILPNIFIRRVSHISFMSTVTVVSASFVFFIVNLYCFTEYKQWDITQLEHFSLSEFVSSCGVIIASYSSQMYLSVIEENMAKPQCIKSVMNAGYAAMTLLKIGIGVIAYITFGKETSQVVTLNLPSGVLLTAVNIVVVLLSLSSYTLPMFTVFEIIEKDSFWIISGDQSNDCNNEGYAKIPIEKNLKKVNMRRIIIRISLVSITLVMALSVPHFCLVLAFIGSFTGSFLEMIFPCFFQLKLKYDEISNLEKLLDGIIIIFSFLFMGMGTYFSAIALEKAFRLHTTEIWSID
ncbi:vesicular inhibitory amino acid transporter [Hydra vulgaris]|uniref:vesicular inhibitory amino acid transporter n=1 Tax=Hydra vulgaris TaxID=6087 RepID=UPI0001924855|nr:vesicular inhibitory amino acid transporter [Hydra vulgaris]